jgi:hypothetical protein
VVRAFHEPAGFGPRVGDVAGTLPRVVFVVLKPKENVSFQASGESTV